MPAARYATAPIPSTHMPTGLPYILSNEVAERFSYYGMRTILVIFMTQYLMGADGTPDVMTEAEAKVWYHNFSSAVYFTPVFGALLADIVLGKYRTILGLSVVYCLGHLALALDETRLGLSLGLTLIAIGSGGIKPCVSAHLGDQFGQSNGHLLSRAYSFFYFGINLGAFASTLLTPLLLDRIGPHVAFGLPGLLMATATVVFWVGRREFVHVPPGGRAFAREIVAPDSLRSLARLGVLYLFIAPFWALFDQTGSSWVFQAQQMDRHLFGIEWLPSQFQAMNPLLIMLLIPLFSFVVYPFVGRFARVTPMRKIATGLFITAAAFGINVLIEVWIAAGQTPSIAWQLFAYVILTSAEVLVSITALEYSYTQAPRRLKSVVMSGYLLSVSLGNQFTSIVNALIQDDAGESVLDGTEYFLFFTGVMLATAVLFVPIAARFRDRTFLQEEQPAPAERPHVPEPPPVD
jgi:POT family proton-dependent oligopeptide transporter